MIRRHFDRFAVPYDPQGHAHRITAHAVIAQPSQQRDPLGRKGVRQGLRYFWLCTRQQARPRDQRDLDAHPAHHPCQFRADVSRADEDQTFR